MISLAAAALLTACGSDIEYAEPDNWGDRMQVYVSSVSNAASQDKAPAAAKAVELARRAEDHAHSPWDSDRHAHTLGVYGYADGNPSSLIFDNQQMDYDPLRFNWQYSPAKYWQEYSSAASFDFLGYMVEGDVPEAQLTSAGSSMTLSFPASFDQPLLTNAYEAPLICHTPCHTTLTGAPIPLQMDQTLTGYSIQFQLGDKMSALRYFVIKSVKVYGNAMPVSGTVSRTYTLTDGTWSAGSVTWSNVTTQNVDKASAIGIATDWASAASNAQKTVSSQSSWMQWGGTTIADGAFFTIPYDGFRPTIEVVYDVYTDADSDGQGGTLSRKDVRSTIVLNATNFANLATGTIGEIHPVRIKIVPEYIYNLADDDMTTGFLVVD